MLGCGGRCARSLCRRLCVARFERLRAARQRRHDQHACEQALLLFHPAEHDASHFEAIPLATQALRGRIMPEFCMTAAPDRAGTLFVVATPIGNLADLAPRVRTVLENADLVLAEDTRHT